MTGSRRLVVASTLLEAATEAGAAWGLERITELAARLAGGPEPAPTL